MHVIDNTKGCVTLLSGKVVIHLPRRRSYEPNLTRQANSKRIYECTLIDAL